MQSTMTSTNNNNSRNVGNFKSIVYDSDKGAAHVGKNRVAVSATEVELFDEIPGSYSTENTNPRSNVSNQARVTEPPTLSTYPSNQNQPNNFETLSRDKDRQRSSVAYPEANNQDLNIAVDKLLERYAPE